MNLLNRRITEVAEAGDLITRLYAERGMAALDRGDRDRADYWLGKIAGAEARTEQHALRVRMEES